MSTTTAVPGVEATIAAAIAERDAGINLAETADTTGWDRALIDQAIDAFAHTGEVFSANDLRDLLPADVRHSLVGARFLAASNADRIRFVGYTRSTKKNTHYARIAMWRGTPTH